MADSHIAVTEGAGKNVQTFQNAIGGTNVEAEAVTLVSSSGTEVATAAAPIRVDPTGTTTQPISDAGGSVTVDGTVAVSAIAGALPAGANAIGKLAANSGVDIGDVDVTSVTPGTAAANLGKAEDAGHASGDTGVMMLGVRNDTPTALNGADLDYTPIATDKYGRVQSVPGKWWTSINTADINDAANGDNSIIAAQGAGTYIVVWSVLVVSDGTVDVRFEDGAGGTALTGQIPLQAREGFSYAGGGNMPLWVLSANTALNLELSAAINVHGSVTYTVES